MHTATEQILRWFETGHMKPELAAVVEPFAELARKIATTLEGPEATAALRKLLESKDCAVRAAVVQLNIP
ncbi:hypothetical protein SAMN05428985_11022 [Nocardioides sp. YR527]|uniref:hypothetical protein n=1 Tax=Nocardioides sp. YR527 TaxID=1881028 RepID=UPI000887E735|nr:hypothetical protein [Nocardioides sp. YR527]SDL14156.1 hypothetical protein SAMN05428985_11022 [Nocardioides sp. YR527]